MTTTTTAITDFDFGTGLFAALSKCRFGPFQPLHDEVWATDGGSFDYCYDLSFRQAWAFLDAEYGDRVVFAVALDAYGRSAAAHDVLRHLVSAQLLEIRTNTPRALWLTFDGTEDHYIERSHVDAEHLTELAHRWCAEYRRPREQRSWPDGYHATKRDET